jgi:cysteine desulfurase
LQAKDAVAAARESIASSIGAKAKELVFTSGATESNNLALKGVARAGRATRDHLVSVATEHRAVLDPLSALAREGFATTVLPVDAKGRVAPEIVASALGEHTALVSVMAANNEIGVLQPLRAIAEVCHARSVPLHTDAAQAVGRIPFDVGALGLDLASFCAHKLGGPKGVGALYVRRRRPRLRIEPLLHGGGHEYGLRSGTLPVALIVGFAKAVELAVEEREAESARLAALRDRLLARLAADPGGVTRNGDPEHALPHNLSVAFDGVDAVQLLAALPGVALSTGSACSSAAPGPSHVLVAMGLASERIAGTVRVGLGRDNTQAQVDRAAALIAAAVTRLRGAQPAAAKLPEQGQRG